jgi:hypothetical protein
LEYPGAADIMVGGQPIGKTTDGLHYLRFLIVMKKDLGRDKCLSQHQRLTGTSEHFQSNRIAASIDCIVYMTYNPHRQWDYGNMNAYDICPSGKCIRG